jgi:hypothetical protein
MKRATAVDCVLPAVFGEGGDDGAAVSDALIARNAYEFAVVGVCFQSGRKPRLRE